MSKWIIVSDNHTESGVLYQIYEMHPDADVYLHLGDSNSRMMIRNLAYLIE